jgi:hypothetical protein
MPDVREKKLKEQSRWLSLLEAVEYVRLAEKCSSIEAQIQLKDQIAEKTIPVKWADGGSPEDLWYLQNSKLILSGHGLAADISSYRPLSVLRRAVASTWPAKGEKAHNDKTVLRPKHGQLIRGGKELEKWMTLVRAIEHIQVVEKCDSVEALRQLKEEIADQTVGIMWADSMEHSDRPDAKQLSATQFILTGLGFAPDDDELRPLLLQRAVVFQLWSKPAVGSAATPPSASNTKPTHKGGRPSAREKIRASLHEMAIDGLSVDGPPKTLASVVAERNGAVLGKQGWSDRTVCDHIRKWQADRKSTPPARE